MAVDLFETRTLLEPLMELRPPRTFLLKMFFKVIKEFETKFVDLDIFTGKRRRAVYVHRRGQGQEVEKQGFKTRTLEPPYVKPKMPTQADDLLNRRPGDILHNNNVSNVERAAKELAENLADLDMMINRSEEIQASEILFDDLLKVRDLEGKEVVADITFGRDSTLNNFVPSTLWTAGGSDPFADLREMRRRIKQASGVRADIVVMPHDVTDVFLKNAEVKSQLDNRRFELGSIRMEIQNETDAIFIGTIHGFDIWEHTEFFFDDVTDQELEIIPTGTVLVGSTEARAERLYGAISDISKEDGAMVAAMMRFPKTWVEDDPSVRFVQLHSAPLMSPHQVNGFGTIKPLP